MTISELELATRDQVNARRNYLMGLWAGQKLGLTESELPRYVSAVMAADFQEPGPLDVVRKLKQDFAATGLYISESEVMTQLKAAEKSVRSELLSTD
ncbi:MAG: ATPase inhibitor subunit zeta [Pseudomonadota bacterium]